MIFIRSTAFSRLLKQVYVPLSNQRVPIFSFILAGNRQAEPLGLVLPSSLGLRELALGISKACTEECGTGQAQAGALPLAAALESSQTARWLEGAQLSMAQRLFSQEYWAVSPPQAAHEAALPAK